MNFVALQRVEPSFILNLSSILTILRLNTLINYILIKKEYGNNKKIVQHLSETIPSTPLLYQFLSICFFVRRFSNAVLQCNLNWRRRCCAVQAIHDWFNLICSLNNMYEQFTGGQIAIVNECDVK